MMQSITLRKNLKYNSIMCISASLVSVCLAETVRFKPIGYNKVILGSRPSQPPVDPRLDPCDPHPTSLPDYSRLSLPRNTATATTGPIDKIK
jgi:hypothetical protein